MYVYMYKYIYIYMCVCLYLYIYLCKCVYTYVNLNESILVAFHKAASSFVLIPRPSRRSTGRRPSPRRQACHFGNDILSGTGTRPSAMHSDRVTPSSSTDTSLLIALTSASTQDRGSPFVFNEDFPEQPPIVNESTSPRVRRKAFSCFTLTRDRRALSL